MPLRLKRDFYLKYVSRRQPFEFKVESFQQKFFLVIQCEAIRSERFENGHFHKPTTHEQHVYTSSGQKITFFARHEYGRVKVFRIKL